MSTCNNNQYIAVGDTVILYTGKESKVEIPHDLNCTGVRRIGDGAFMQLDKLTDVKIPNDVASIGQKAFYFSKNLKTAVLAGTIENIGKDAFWGCDKLRDIILYDIKLTKREYSLLKKNALQYGQCKYASAYIPDYFNKIGLEKALYIHGAVVIPRGAPILFVSYDHNNKGAKRLYADSEYISGTEYGDPMWEDKAFKEHIRRGIPEIYSHIAEQHADEQAKRNMSGNPEKIFLFTFNDSETKMDDHSVKITANLKIGYFFWQSARKVICDGNEYYIYRRNYLSSDRRIEYVQVDTAVYRGTDLVIDRTEAQRVYGKYRLLSLL